MQTDSGEQELKTYTRDEVARHCKMEDAWVIVDGFVYDITPCMRIKRHTEAMVSRDLGRDISVIFKQIHSQRAKALLTERRIGVLSRGSSAPAPAAARPPPPTFATPAPPSSRITVSPPKQ